MRVKKGEPFEYWIGVFMPAGTQAPEGALNTGTSRKQRWASVGCAAMKVKYMGRKNYIDDNRPLTMDLEKLTENKIISK